MTTIDMSGASDAEFEARVAPFEADVPGWVHDPDDICERACCGPTLPVAGDVQRELAEVQARRSREIAVRDDLLTAAVEHREANRLASALLVPGGAVQRIIADAEKRAAAAALRDAAEWLAMQPVPPRPGLGRAMAHLRDRADALDPQP